MALVPPFVFVKSIYLYEDSFYLTYFRNYAALFHWEKTLSVLYCIRSVEVYLMEKVVLLPLLAC